MLKTPKNCEIKPYYLLSCHLKKITVYGILLFGGLRIRVRLNLRLI